MSATNDKEGRGFLYPKKDRQGRQPNLTGKLTWHGEEIEIAAWKQQSKNGVPYLSLKAQESGSPAATAGPTRTGTAEVDATDFETTQAPLDDDIPF